MCFVGFARRVVEIVLCWSFDGLVYSFFSESVFIVYAENMYF